MNVKKGKKHHCTVVWQLLLLLLEIVGGRLCPVAQNKKALAAMQKLLTFFKLLFFVCA